LHGFKQIVRFDFLYLDIRIADDAERICSNDLQAGEERCKIITIARFRLRFEICGKG
jgi:hypothetical protein